MPADADRATGFDTTLPLAIDGEPTSVERVLATIRPLVMRYCRARMPAGQHSLVSPDDVAQEVCLAVLSALPAYRDQGRPFLAFVYGIAAHKVADAHRAAARDRSEPVPDLPERPALDAEPETTALSAELNGRLGRLLALLPRQQREIVVLRVVVGLSAEETGAAVGVSPGSVRVAQHRALTKLRAWWQV
ncbi:RNA polymerase sigma factor ShbA [Amycolatopsis sp. SID8362]|uniref:RNA polymerase sigma factor ShbA n=1 Tax=Amycolatopsis sp. SID8362 TaxID=2690346 RepID=UPI001368BE9E|nr:RNA polymerase sigma factor ShbA [Amycolatopsis sp. SID8362]NBH07229.1 sigma-70 family RNA polymerase sigma factor [Amycolatopsis sp. SID8362]NED43925.1 sigma-70 family RNA polymerase sigma factor [Amycolatopsis sp. SID8362]